MSITIRSIKGAALTHSEMDINFTDLRDGVDLKVPKTKGKGLKVDSLGTPSFGWQDLLGAIGKEEGGPNTPNLNAYIGNIKQYAFDISDEVFVEFHLPHDYAPGTDIYIHTHWSHKVPVVGNVTWGFEVSYAKGHNQAAFSAPITTTILQASPNIALQHMIAEVQFSASTPSGVQIDTDNIEVDGLLLTRIFLSANTTGVAPFLHFVDIHYQSTNIPTKQKAPDFWV